MQDSATLPPEARKYQANQRILTTLKHYQQQHQARLTAPVTPWDFGQARVWRALDDLEQVDVADAILRIATELGLHDDHGDVRRRNLTGDQALEWAGSLGALEFIAGIIEASR